MEKWRKWLLPALLALALVTTGAWGYREKLARQDLQNRAESQYQKNFYELAWQVDTISGNIAQLLVSASREQAVLGLSGLWRQVFAAQANIGGLPLSFVPLSQTEKFLSDTGVMTHAMLSRVTKEAEGLRENDLEVLKQLYERSKTLKKDLADLSAKILDKGLSWTEVEVASASSNVQMKDNTILDGFQLMEQKMEEYPEVNTGEDFEKARPEVKRVTGAKKTTLDEAEENARRWLFGQDDKHTARLVYEGAGNIPTFGLEFPPLQGEESPVYIDISKLDGTVLWSLKPKAVDGAKIDFAAGEQKAREFLQSHGFTGMELVEIDQEDDSGIYMFVPRQGEVLLYPDQVQVAVALDDGEVIGYEGTPYYMNHRERTIAAPALSEEEIRDMLSPNLKVELIRPALICNYWDQEVLTWEVRGSYDEENFAIFYNAQTGSEEEFTRLTVPLKYSFEVAT